MVNKIGVCDFSFPCRGPIAIELAGEAGYQGMQISDAGGVAAGSPLLYPKVREAYMEAAEKAGVEFQGLNLEQLCFSNIMGSPLDTPNGEYIKRSIRDGAEICRLMGMHSIMINVNNIHFISKPSPEIMENIRQTLIYANNLCQENGVTVAIETCIPPHMFHDLRAEIGDNLKMCLDIANPIYHGVGEPSELILAYGLDAIDHFHIKDFKKGYFGYLTQDCVMCYPGEGGAGFEKCVEIINNGGFKGWFISESIFTLPVFYGKEERWDYLAAARKDVDIMRRAFL